MVLDEHFAWVELWERKIEHEAFSFLSWEGLCIIDIGNWVFFFGVCASLWSPTSLLSRALECHSWFYQETESLWVPTLFLSIIYQ